jgi:HlyD family secretion protein
MLRAAHVRKSEAEAAQQLAQLGVDAMVIKAPISGIIIDKKVAVGQAVSPLTSAPLFTIAGSLEAMEAHAQVPESDISKIRVGQRALFSLSDSSTDDSPAESKRTRFEGKVVEIRPMPANLQGAVFYTVVVNVHNQRDPETREWQLRPGLPVAVDIIRREHANAWLVPTDALDFRLDEHYQSPEAKKKIQEWEQQWGTSPARNDWKQIWILDTEGKPWPVHVRTGGKNSKGENGLRGTQDATEDSPGGEYQEILEWEPDAKLQSALESGNPTSYPEVITDAPPVQKRSIIDVPKIPKIF